MLDFILEKLGIKSIDDLKPAEQATYRSWGAILSKPDITLEDLKKFLPKELERANTELRRFDNSEKKDMYYKAYAEFCQNLTRLLISPSQEREALRTFLKQKYDIQIP